MFRVVFSACAVGLFSAGPSVSQDLPIEILETQINLSTAYVECKNTDDDAKRLICYDGLLTKVFEMTEASSNYVPGECEVEAWSYTKKAGSAYITGSTTCSTGKLNYRLYAGDNDQFLASGFTFIEGFAFQTYADVGTVPRNMNLKATVTRQ